MKAVPSLQARLSRPRFLGVSGPRVRADMGGAVGRNQGGRHVAGGDSRSATRRPRCCSRARHRGAGVSLCQGDIISFVGLHVVNGFFTHSLPGFFPFLIVCSYICRPWCVEFTAERIPPCWGLQIGLLLKTSACCGDHWGASVVSLDKSDWLKGF